MSLPFRATTPRRASRLSSPRAARDFAAASVVIGEAGGRMSDLDGAPLDFSRGEMLPAGVRGIIASNGRLHDAALAALAATEPADAR